MEDYYEYLDSNGVTTLYKLIKDDTVALVDSYSVTINGITTTLDTHINNMDIHTPIADIESMVDTKIACLVNSAPETLDTLKELSDALGNDPNFATTVVNQIGNKADKDTVYTKLETDTLLEDKANSVHTHVVKDITDFPTIPTKTSQLINDSGFLTSSSGVITSVSWSDITNKPNFSTVATSGSYTDLSNTPTIPTKVSQLENDMGFGTGGDTSDCVHKTGNEIIAGIKTFSDITVSNKELHYRDTLYDWSDTSINTWCDAGNVAWFDKTGNRRMHELVGANGGVWRKACYINENQYFSVDSNRNISYWGTVNFNGKIFAHNGFVGNLQGNADTATKASCLDNYSVPGMNKIYLDWDHQVKGYVGLKVDNTVMGGLITTKNIGSYVNSRAGFSAMGSSVSAVNSVAGNNTVSSSVSAYWSNSSNVTATGQNSSERNYPECYSNYVTKTPAVGVIYSGAQLYTVLNTSASATGKLGGSVQNRTYITSVTAQATFSNPISSTGKYLCTTANTVRFRAYAPGGNSAGTASVIDNSSTKSIFIRVE